jgi:hypothetical protein
MPTATGLVQLLMLAPEAVVDQYEHRGLDELVSMCDARGIELSLAEREDPDAVRDALRQGVSEIVKAKARRKHKRVKLTDEERRREGIERQVLEECARRRVRPSEVAEVIMRNAAEVRGIMMDLTHRGRLESRDGYKTFRTVGS